MTKSAPRVMKRSDANFVPRFEYGEMAQAAHLCGTDDGSKLGAGLVRLTKAEIPWTVKYDEMLTVFEGELTLHADGTSHKLGPRDSIWIPSGTELEYEAQNALVHYAIHPANWNEIND